MNILYKNIFVEQFESKIPVNEINAESAENNQNQVTPQNVIDSLPSYTVRLNESYLHPGNSCTFCYRTYSVGDRVTCLPCQHHFHNHCIENWLKWVKPTCPEDKKSVILQQHEEELTQESQNRILHEKTKEGARCNSSHGKVTPRSGERLEITSVENLSLKAARKKQEAQAIQTAESTTETLTDFSSVISVVGYGRKKHRRSKPKESNPLHECFSKDESHQKEEWHTSPCTINDKAQEAMFIMSPDKRKRMQESIDAIRRSLNRGVSTAKKRSGNPKEFQQALNVAVTKLSKTRICSPPETESKDLKSQFESISQKPPGINKESEKHTAHGLVMGNTEPAFSYFRESGNAPNTGWVYERATFDR